MAIHKLYKKVPGFTFLLLVWLFSGSWQTSNAQKVRRLVLYVYKGEVSYKLRGKWIKFSTPTFLDDTCWINVVKDPVNFMLIRESDCAQVTRRGLLKIRRISFAQCANDDGIVEWYRKLIIGIKPKSDSIYAAKPMALNAPGHHHGDSHHSASASTASSASGASPGASLELTAASKPKPSSSYALLFPARGENIYNDSAVLFAWIRKGSVPTLWQEFQSANPGIISMHVSPTLARNLLGDRNAFPKNRSETYLDCYRFPLRESIDHAGYSESLPGLIIVKDTSTPNLFAWELDVLDLSAPVDFNIASETLKDSLHIALQELEKARNLLYPADYSVLKGIIYTQFKMYSMAAETYQDGLKTFPNSRFLQVANSNLVKEVMLLNSTPSHLEPVGMQ